LYSAYILSIRPRFGEAIISGRKLVELRRLTGRLIRPGDRVFLYFTAPVKAVMGMIDVGDVVVGSGDALRSALRDVNRLGIWDEDWGYTWPGKPNMAIFVERVLRCLEPIGIRELARLGIRVPRSYARLDPGKAVELMSMCGV